MPTDAFKLASSGRRPLCGAVALLIAGCAATDGSGPPIETGEFHPSDLVEIARVDSSVKLDIRYATANNFLGRAVYTEARAFLQRPAAEALSRVSAAIKNDGYALLIYDGYRPWSVTKVFWDETPAEKHDFVANPAKGSRHNRGCAVDLSLVDAATGRPIAMPSAYDEFTERAYPNYAGGTEAERRNRDYLRSAMEREGFTVYEFEWWHFDFKEWQHYRVENLGFSDIPRGGK